MIHYIIQTIAFQVFFLLVYDVFLKNETFFNWNRLYLLGTAILSIALPFIKVDGFKNVVPQQYIIRLPEVFIGDKPQLNTSQLQVESINTQSQTMLSWELLFYLGMVLAALLFIFKITKIVWLLSQNPKSKIGRLRIVKLLNSSAAFSFFNYVFLGEQLSQAEKDTILKHEMIHVNQNHSLDLLFFEVARILFWFNPLIYMYQNRMTTLHEFIADEQAVKHQNKSEYYQSLLTQIFDTNQISFINPFFKQSLIKKRIVMLQKSKSKQINLLKYAIIVPMVLGMMIYVSSIQNVYSQQKETQNIEAKTLKSPLIEKIQAIKEQIQVQGNTNKDEEYGLDLLLKLAKSNTLNESLIKEVQDYSALNNKTPLMERISDVFNQIQVQGNMTTEEEEALKELLVFTSDGFNDPFFNDVIQDVSVPFAVVEHVPVYPGCESLNTNDERKKCMAEHISDFINKSFNTKIGKENGLVGRQRINVMFKIDYQGHIVDVKSRAPHPALEAEAIRVVKSLPKMEPGKQKGKAVNVMYSLPIIFQIAEDKPMQQKE
jgi:hypothetical protein